MEKCECGKWRAMSQVKVIKKVDRETQPIVSGEKRCAILSGDEFVRRQWRHLVRMVKEMEQQFGFRFDSEK